MTEAQQKEFDKAREKLKAGKEEKKETPPPTSEALIKTAGGVAVSAAVAERFRQSAHLGSENLSASLPQLKVSEANSNNVGVDGELVPAGTFYYSPTKEYFKDVEVSIMTITRGFYAMSSGKEPKPKFTQLMGGMILETRQPFVMFLGGTRLERMWEFGKLIKPMTSNRQAPIPMYAFKVKLSLERIKTSEGSNHILVFELIKTPEGQLEIMSDPDLIDATIAGVERLNDTFASFIEQKEVDRATGRLLKDMARNPEPLEEDRPTTVDDFPSNTDPAALTPDEEKKAQTEPPSEEINPDDVPF